MLGPIWSARPRSGRAPSQPTVLTVLTQTPPFGTHRRFRMYGDALKARAQFNAPTSERLHEAVGLPAALGGGGLRVIASYRVSRRVSCNEPNRWRRSTRRDCHGSIGRASPWTFWRPSSN